MATRVYSLVYEVLLPIIEELVILWSRFTEESVYNVLSSLLPDEDVRPLLHDLLERALDLFNDYIPSISSVSLFEFMCGGAIIILVGFTLVKWIIDVVT